MYYEATVIMGEVNDLEGSIAILRDWQQKYTTEHIRCNVIKCLLTMIFEDNSIMLMFLDQVIAEDALANEKDVRTLNLSTKSRQFKKVKPQSQEPQISSILNWGFVLIKYMVNIG